MRIWIALVAGCVAGLFSMAQGAGAVGLQPVGNFIEPVYMTSPPGDPRLFVVERGGRIQVVHDGTTSQFLDIHDRTTTVGDRGMLSMAFDPNYARTGLFYVFYTGTAAADGQEGLGHVDEFQVSSNPNVADAATRRPVLTISRPNATAASSSSAGTAISTSRSETGRTATQPHRTSLCSTASCYVSIRMGRPRAPTRSRPITRSPHRAPRVMRSGRPAFAIRGDSHSTPEPVI